VFPERIIFVSRGITELFTISPSSIVHQEKCAKERLAYFKISHSCKSLAQTVCTGPLRFDSRSAKRFNFGVYLLPTAGGKLPNISVTFQQMGFTEAAKLWAFLIPTVRSSATQIVQYCCSCHVRSCCLSAHYMTYVSDIVCFLLGISPASEV